MQLPKAQYKIMLLFARLLELEQKKEGVGIGGKGRVCRDTRANGEQCFFLISPGMEATELISVDRLKMLCAARTPHSNTNKKKLDDMVKKLFPRQTLNDHPISSDQVTVRAFADRIILDKERARYIIDSMRAHELPTYSAVSQGRAAAEKFTDKYGGIYYLYRHDLNEETRSGKSPAGAIVRAMLSIRYPVPYKAYGSKKRGQSRIRCKLAIPAYGTRKPTTTLVYDGFVGPKGRWHQFLFQARWNPKDPRTRKGEDLILMYTEALPTAGWPAMTRGVMMTQNQEHGLTPTVSTIAIVRVPDRRVQKEQLSGLGKIAYAYPYLDHFYKLEPKDEHEFMNDRAEVFYLGDPAKALSAEVGEAAQKLFKGWPALNTYGLHR